jgi:putative flippase GtrA
MRGAVASGLWFGAVGATAAGVHLSAFELIHRYWAPGLLPEVANGVAFLVAVGVSFAGHRLLSFPDSSITLRHSMLRFFGSAFGGFITNELVFSALLHVVGLAPRPALVIALLVAAGQTFLLGRYWAFRR